MDGFTAHAVALRILFLVLLYVFLFAVARVAAARPPGGLARVAAELGRLVVLASPRLEPPPRRPRSRSTRSTTIGRDVNNSIVVDDPFASSRARGAHVPRPQPGTSRTAAAPTARSSTASRSKAVAPLGFGDEVQVGEVRFRLDRGHA